MGKETDILILIREKKDKLSRSHKKIAEYVLNNPDEAAFLTASKLGKNSGTSESTVVRFAYSLGFKGYPEFQKSLADMVTDKIHSFERIDISGSNIDKENVLDKVLKGDSSKILMTLEQIDRRAFDLAVENILKAENVYVVGARSCAPLASFLSYYLKIIRKNVHEVTSSNASELFEQMIHLTENDVVVGISFPRYSVRTLKAMEFANNRNACVIAVTDSKHSPMNMYSSVNLFAKSDMASIVDSLVAPMSVINSLIVALCLKNHEQVISNIEEIEDLLYNYQYNETDDINLVDYDAFDELKKMSGV